MMNEVVRPSMMAVTLRSTSATNRTSSTGAARVSRRLRPLVHRIGDPLRGPAHHTRDHLAEKRALGHVHHRAVHPAVLVHRSVVALAPSLLTCPRDACRIGPAGLEPSALERSALGVRLSRLAVELVTDDRLGTDDPRVVAGLDHVGVAGADLDGRTIRVLYVESPRRHRSDVVHLTSLGPRHGLDALRPPPPRLQGHSTHLHGAEIDDFDLCLVGSPTLVRGVEALRGDPCHLVLPRSPTLELNILARHHYSVQHEPVNARTSPNDHRPLKCGDPFVVMARIASLLSSVARPCS